MNKRSLSGQLLFGIAVLVVFLGVTKVIAAEKGINCSIHKGARTQALGAGEIILEINPKPVTAMKDLVFKVTVKNLSPSSAPVIDLSMPGMHMGKNKVNLQEVTPDVYQGVGVIVRCPSGRRLWQATVDVPDVGTAAFRFDVVY